MHVATSLTLVTAGLASMNLLAVTDTYPMGLPNYWHLNGLDSLMQATLPTL
jgi:hypothetical protein